MIHQAIFNHLKGDESPPEGNEIETNESQIPFPDPQEPFTAAEEIQDAMEQCNFDKAIGEDGFDGRILK